MIAILAFISGLCFGLLIGTQATMNFYRNARENPMPNNTQQGNKNCGWTKGLWNTEDYPRGVSIQGSIQICKLSGVHGETMANAHLIAAAPDLYAAAEKALGRFCGCRSSSRDDWHAEHCAVPDLRAALAKARGESNG